MKIDKLLELAKAHFDADEEPLSTVQGFYDTKTSGGGRKRNGILVVTNLRMIFFAKKLGGFDFEAFSYGSLSSIFVGRKTWLGHRQIRRFRAEAR